MNMRRLLLLCSIALFFCASSLAFATNGMLLEGYGPISHALGGASMAFDHGTAAMNANPATLGLMPEGNRLDIAVGMLSPTVSWETPMGDFDSQSNYFFMPAMGFVRKQGNWAYGAGVFAQGGMGTDYRPEMPMYSQVSVGKVLVPVAYSIADRFTVGATAEFVWAGMDLVMAPIFDFRDKTDLTGAATGTGFTGSVGVVYKVADWLNVGGAYQFKSNLGDLKGDGATVKGFDFPAFAAAGISLQATDQLQLVVDYKRIFWADVMKTITVSQNGITMDMKQNWKDQNVFSIGAAYSFVSEFTWRVGASFANNPVQENCNPLFPAIMKNHYTTGFGVKLSDAVELNASFGFAPQVRQENADMMGMKSSTTHSQVTSQVMVSYTF